MLLSVIVPVYNEASTLAALLSRVQAVPLEMEILIVDDGSDSATKVLLEESLPPEIRLITHSFNKGKGAAVRSALSEATGEAVIIQDADLEYFPEDYLHLVETYKKEKAQAVYGVRDLSTRSSLMRWGNRAMTTATNILYGTRLNDMETCYKLVDRELLQSLDLQSRRFEIEAEITAKLVRLGAKIFEVPIKYEPRQEGKKLTPWDGLPTLSKLISCRFWNAEVKTA